MLLLETSGLPEFARTRAFYRTNGYDEEARIREFYAAGEDKVVFRKALVATPTRPSCSVSSSAPGPAAASLRPL